MSVSEYLAELKDRTGLEKIGDAQDGNILCAGPNHTHFDIIDPEDLAPEERRDWLEYQIANLQTCARGY
ncbi:MAG: hypothetical protein WBF53_00525 [Litorimonas sp.]